MTTLADRLRGVIRPARPAGLPSSASEPQVPARVDATADVLDGAWHDSGGQRYLVVDRTYRPGHRHGDHALAEVLPPLEGPWPGLSLLGAAAGGMLFLDVETIGLAGGAGTYAFLVGAAWFDGGVLRLRQWFLASFAAEPALLAAVADAASTCGTIVTYNGKTFDLPLLDTRYVLHRIGTPFAGRPHVDMLHAARRLWRAEDDEAAGTSSSCKLTQLEESLLGHVREWDVPGFEIPARYFHYVRSGDARPLAPVFEHNRQDLVSLAFMAARAAHLLEHGSRHAATGREALGLGYLYERAGRVADACACYARAAGLDGDRDGSNSDGRGGPLLAHIDPSTRAQALRAFAVLARRQKRFGEAASAWAHLVELHRCPAHITRQAIEALAVYHEHRLRDPRAAKSLALQSLSWAAGPSHRRAAEHRLARLDRKLASAVPRTAALF